MPNHQRLIRNLSWLIGGFLVLGTFLDAVSNAIALVKLPLAIFGTSAIVISWVLVQYLLKRNPIDWKIADGNLVKIKKLGVRFSLPFVGMIILLWMPLGVQWFQSIDMQSSNFEEEKEGEILIVITTFTRSDGVDDARVQDEIRRAIEPASVDLNYTKIRVEIAPDEIESGEQDKATEIGAMYDASFAVFGDQTSVRVSSHYLNLKLLPFRSDFGDEITFPLSNNEGYILTTRLPAQIVFRLFFDIGQSYFEEAKYDEALEVTLTAINYSFYELSKEDLGAGYFFIGQIFEQQKNQTQAERYFCSSQSFDPTLTLEMSLDCVFPKPLRD